MSSPINRFQTVRPELRAQAPAVPPTNSIEADDAARRQDFGQSPEADSKLEQDEHQVRLHLQHQTARRPRPQGSQRQGDSQAEGVQADSLQEEEDNAVAALAQAGDAGDQDAHGDSQQHGGQGRGTGYVAWQATRRQFEHSLAALPVDAADHLRTLAVNLRGLPDSQAAPLLAAALAQCMVTMVNNAETEHQCRGALTQALEQLAMHRLLRDSRLKLRTTLPGAKAALIAADVAWRQPWQRKDEGDDARLLLPLLYLNACRRHNQDNGFAEV